MSTISKEFCSAKNQLLVLGSDICNDEFQTLNLNNFRCKQQIYPRCESQEAKPFSKDRNMDLFNKQQPSGLKSLFKASKQHSFDGFFAKKGAAKSGSKANDNSSSLSLHISAYENSIAFENASKKKACRGVKAVFTAKPLVNPFELPRQMPSGTSVGVPEVMQFATSQRMAQTDAGRPQRQSAIAATERMRDCLDYASSFTDKPEYFYTSDQGSLHGVGLFSRKDLVAKFVGLRYNGPKITPFESDLRELECKIFGGDAAATYMMNDKRHNLVIDARDEETCLMKFANHSHAPNAEFVDSREGTPYLRTLKPVKAGTEILVQYDLIWDDFWSPSICFCRSPACKGLLEREDCGKALEFLRHNPSFEEDVKALMRMESNSEEFENEKMRLLRSLIFDAGTLQARELVAKLRQLPTAVAKAVIRSGKFEDVGELKERADEIIAEVEAEIAPTQPPPSPVHPASPPASPPASLPPSPRASLLAYPPPGNPSINVSAVEMENVFAVARSEANGSYIADDGAPVRTGTTRGLSRISHAPHLEVMRTAPGIYVLAGGRVNLGSDDYDDENDEDFRG